MILNHKGFGLLNDQKEKLMKPPEVVYVVMVFTKGFLILSVTHETYFGSNTFILRLYLSPALKSSQENIQACDI